MVLLFWRKNNITITTLIHTVIVGILVSIAWENHNLLQEYELIIELSEHLNLRFDYMKNLVIGFTLPVLAIWHYQWWFIGKEKDKLFSHNI